MEWWNRKTPHSSFAGPILSSPFPMQTSAANSGYLQAIKKPWKFTKQTTACELPHRNPSGISTNQNTTQTSDIKHCVGTRHHTTHLCIHSVKVFSLHAIYGLCFKSYYEWWRLFLVNFCQFAWYFKKSRLSLPTAISNTLLQRQSAVPLASMCCFYFGSR